MVLLQSKNRLFRTFDAVPNLFRNLRIRAKKEPIQVHLVKCAAVCVFYSLGIAPKMQKSLEISYNGRFARAPFPLSQVSFRTARRTKRASIERRMRTLDGEHRSGPRLSGRGGSQAALFVKIGQFYFAAVMVLS